MHPTPDRLGAHGGASGGAGGTFALRQRGRGRTERSAGFAAKTWRLRDQRDGQNPGVCSRTRRSSEGRLDSNQRQNYEVATRSLPARPTSDR
jgi:hypothetical protein